MRENDELYADSGEPVKESHGVSRGTALKVGGLGLAGALAAFMPGRAGAGLRKKASNASCTGTGFVCILGNYPKFCGYDNYSLGPCYCGSLYYGKLRPAGAPVGACVENVTASPCLGAAVRTASGCRARLGRSVRTAGVAARRPASTSALRARSARLLR